MELSREDHISVIRLDYPKHIGISPIRYSKSRAIPYKKPV